jgi:hypothetical protein
MGEVSDDLRNLLLYLELKLMDECRAALATRRAWRRSSKSLGLGMGRAG